jgi:hypothetical protein
MVSVTTARASTPTLPSIYGELVTATSYSELAELYATYVREQFNTVTEQAQEGLPKSPRRWRLKP